jgi:Right handed beta helix region
MKRVFINTIAAATLVFAATAVQAQATRTWVSGVGDDVNPCSRTAPCKTFAGAISKTAAGGEINVLDPGGFGTITITKSITIDGSAGPHASILASSVNGVTINALSTDTVILRNLSINGGTPSQAGLKGINILAAKDVHVEYCDIFNFLSTGAGSGRGISYTGTGAVSIHVSNTTITNNAQTGIVLLPSSGTPTMNLYLKNVEVKDNGSTTAGGGLFATSGARVMITDSTFSGHNAPGIEGNGTAQINVDNSIIFNNAKGVVTSGSAVMRLGRSVIANNTGAGFEVGVGSTIGSAGDNYINGNGANVGSLTTVGFTRQ